MAPLPLYLPPWKLTIYYWRPIIFFFFKFVLFIAKATVQNAGHIMPQAHCTVVDRPADNLTRLIYFVARPSTLMFSLCARFHLYYIIYLYSTYMSVCSFLVLVPALVTTIYLRSCLIIKTTVLRIISITKMSHLLTTSHIPDPDSFS